MPRSIGMLTIYHHNPRNLIIDDDDAQEWNGRREITEKTFKFDGSTVPSLLFLAVLFPGFIYVVMKDELVRGVVNDREWAYWGVL